MDEASLIGHAAHGDAAAWEPLVLAHQDAVFRLAYLITGDPDEAQDIAQEAFIRAWRSLDRFDRSRPLRPWLFRITSNLANTSRRSLGRYIAALTRSSQAEMSPPSVEQKSALNIQSQQLWQAVRSLSPAEQQLIYLRYFIGLSVEETAETLQTAQGTIKSRTHRALERLRTVIRREFSMLEDEKDA